MRPEGALAYCIGRRLHGLAPFSMTTPREWVLYCVVNKNADRSRPQAFSCQFVKVPIYFLGV